MDRSLEVVPDKAQQKEIFCRLVAEDRLPNAQIAKTVGISEATLGRWKKDPEIVARVTALNDELAERVAFIGIAQKAKRISFYHDVWQRLIGVIEDRAAIFADGDVDDEGNPVQVPGGASGLVTSVLKVTPSGQTFKDYQVDTALLKEIREWMKQAAIERGDWVEKQQNLNLTIQTDLDTLTDDQRQAVRRVVTGREE